MAPRCLPYSALRGKMPGHGMASSPHLGPSLLSRFFPALCSKSYINCPEIIWDTSSKSNDHISDYNSRCASKMPPPFLYISVSALRPISCVTYPENFHLLPQKCFHGQDFNSELNGINKMRKHVSITDFR